MEKKIYSPEPFTGNLMLSDSGNNGSNLRTISINRNNRMSRIYVNMRNSGSVIPRVYRGYIEDGIMKYTFKEYDIINYNGGYIEKIFDFDSTQFHKYITYYVSFEVVANGGATVTLADIGVIYDDFELTSNNNKIYSTDLATDINQIPLSKQEYSAQHNFTITTNRADLEQICNVIEKPFYLVNELTPCINNNSRLLANNGIRPSYVTGATKMIAIEFNNIVGV